MPHRLLLLLCLLAPPLMAADASEEHDLAYSLGARLGERLRDEVRAQVWAEALLKHTGPVLERDECRAGCKRVADHQRRPGWNTLSA